MKYAFVVSANTTASVMLAADSSALEQVQRDYPGAVYQKGRIIFSVGSGRWQVSISHPNDFNRN